MSNRKMGVLVCREGKPWLLSKGDFFKVNEDEKGIVYGGVYSFVKNPITVIQKDALSWYDLAKEDRVTYVTTFLGRYLLEGRRWFDGSGNTYHTVFITSLNPNNFNERIYDSETMAYGYGAHWKQTAYDKLIELDLAIEEDRYNHAMNAERFIYRVSDGKKRDLFN